MQDVANRITLVAEEQVQHIIVAITTATTVTKDKLKKHTIEGFGKVNTSLNSLVNAILKRVPEENVL